MRYDQPFRLLHELKLCVQPLWIEVNAVDNKLPLLARLLEMRPSDTGALIEDVLGGAVLNQKMCESFSAYCVKTR